MDKQIALDQIQFTLNFEGLDPFDSWAFGYFNQEKLRTMVPKNKALWNFQRFINNDEFTSQRFLKELARYCFANKLILNPDELHNAGGRIIRKYKNKATEMIYIKPKE